MRVRMLWTVHLKDEVYARNDLADVDEETGRNLVRRGWAELIGPPESAALAPPENAMLPRPATRTGV